MTNPKYGVRAGGAELSINKMKDNVVIKGQVNARWNMARNLTVNRLMPWKSQCIYKQEKASMEKASILMWERPDPPKNKVKMKLCHRVLYTHPLGYYRT